MSFAYWLVSKRSEIKIQLYFLRQFVFWLVFFQLNRAVFLICHWDKTADAPFGEVISAFWHAAYLDISTACYITTLSFLLISILAFTGFNLFNKINEWYSYLVISSVSILVACEVGVFGEWETKLSYKAVLYLENPGEMFRSTEGEVLVLSAFLILLQSSVGIYSYRQWVHKKFENKSKWYVSLTFLLLTPFLLALGLRGGLQKIPIGQSDVYFSTYNFLNTAAVNSTWNLMHSVMQNNKYMNKNPYEFYNFEQAKKIVQNLHKVEKDTTINILTNKHPNVVLIIVEGWSGDLIQSLGGYEGITPQFALLEKEGLLFTEIYSSGTRSHQGMAAIFSGYPAHPITSIITQPSKFEQLPCINEQFLKAGYNTSFMFGGQLNYGNIKGYMYFNKFHKIIEGKDFSDDIPTGRLGVHDEYLYANSIEELKNEKQPFFHALFTMSSHSPYDYPMEDVFYWGGNHQAYINSVFYSDKCLGDYIAQARKQEWFDNTLFVIIPDHSHDSPKNWHIFSPEYRKIPILFFGNVIKEEFKGVKWNKLGAQPDIAATLMAQLNLEHKQFKWSKNLLNPYVQEFAFYETGDVVGWVRKQGAFSCNYGLKICYHEKFDDTAPKDSIIAEGKSYLQVLFQDYLDY